MSQLPVTLAPCDNSRSAPATGTPFCSWSVAGLLQLADFALTVPSWGHALPLDSSSNGPLKFYKSLFKFQLLRLNQSSSFTYCLILPPPHTPNLLDHIVLYFCQNTLSPSIMQISFFIHYIYCIKVSLSLAKCKFHKTNQWWQNF